MLNLSNYQSIKKFISENGIDGWKSIARQYNSRANNYYKKNKQECLFNSKVKYLFQKTIPDQYKVGVHLIGEGCGFMGEDVYLVDGNITATIHFKHRTCGQYKILNWAGLYCAFCQKEIKADECV